MSEQEEIIIEVDGRTYQLLRELSGSDRHQVVYAETDDGQPIVFKFLRGTARRVARSQYKLQRQHNFHQQFACANVCRSFGLASYQDQSALILEFLPSTVADLRRKERDESTRELTAETLARLIGEAGNALATMHDQGFVHFDVKPDNLGLNGQQEIKLLDFGHTRRIERLNHRSLRYGTLSYSPPEMTRAGSLGPWSDIWSLGLVFYQLMKGIGHSERIADVDQLLREGSFCPETVTEESCGYPQWLCDVVNDCLQTRPRERISNGGELADRISAAKRLSGSTTNLSGENLNQKKMARLLR